MQTTRPLVFIIEDDEPLGRVYSLALKDFCKVETITDGAAALERLKNSLPAIVLLDLNLPGASGEAVLAAIRAEPHLEKTRVILCTGDEQQANWLEVKADYILLKPISPIQLRMLVSRLTQNEPTVSNTFL